MKLRQFLRQGVIGAGAVLLMSVAAKAEVKTNETWTETFPVSGATPTLEISNIWGDVVVQTGSADMIEVHITEQRSAPDQERFDRSLETLALTIENNSENVRMLVGDRENQWHSSRQCRGCRVEYRFDVRVPVNTRLMVSTVNDGKVEVKGIQSLISASNVNGPVSVSGLKDCEAVNSVNGAVKLSFSSPPARNCEIETVNGDVTIGLPTNSGVNVAMDLFNGKMRSELPVAALAIPATVEHSQVAGRDYYKIRQSAGLSIAGGGPTFSISSINGDIQIQKIN